MICSYTQQYPAEQVSVSHDHFSTLRLREHLGVETTGPDSVYTCPSCKIRHRAYTDDRIKVAVSDSTLHRFFATPSHMSDQYVGDTQHVDYVTIANATLPELYQAFSLDYVLRHHTKPLDVVIVAGYADLLQGYAREYILDGFKYFTETVLNLGTQRNPDTPNTVAVASLLYPPKLSWFSRDGPKPYRYHNQIEKIDWLNQKIHDLNLKNNRPIYLGLHSYGTRKFIRTHTDSQGQEQEEHIRSHRWEHWEETTRRNKFHLRTDRRFKVGLALNNYFVTRT